MGQCLYKLKKIANSFLWHRNCSMKLKFTSVMLKLNVKHGCKEQADSWKIKRQMQMIILKVNVGHRLLLLLFPQVLLVLILPWFTPVESFQPDHVLLQFVHEEGDSHSVDVTRRWGERRVQVGLSIHPKHHRVRFGLQVPMQRSCIWRQKINGN